MKFVGNAGLVGKVKDLKHLSEEEVVERLKKNVIRMGYEVPVEQENAWKGSWRALKKVLQRIPEDVWVILEYRLMNDQRIDLLFLGKTQKGPSILVLELKGWKRVESLKEYKFLVKGDGKIFLRPDIQAADYAGKLKYTHSEAKNYEIEWAVWLYNAEREKVNLKTSDFFFFKGEEGKLVEKLKTFSGLTEERVKSFLEGEFTQTKHLLQAVKENYEKLKRAAFEALGDAGFAPSEEQMEIIDRVIKALEKGEEITFLIQGGPGSGKSYIALMLILYAIHNVNEEEDGNVAALAYRNNRLLNTLRLVFNDIEKGLGSLLYFSSTRGKTGLADKENKTRFKLAVFDEAQRLSEEQIPIAIKRGKVTVLLYDESQRLTPEEQGTTKNFEEAAEKEGRSIEKFHLKGYYRVRGGRKYHEFVEKLLENPLHPGDFPHDYDFRVFTDIEEMLKALREKASRHKVALVASFTESPGDRKNKRAKNILNRRVGYPLYSGFDHYKGKSVDIYWLMDEKTQYPSYWYGKESQALTHCASVYGCQGFEADYVGVIWGRDLVWNSEERRWTLGTNCEDDVGRPSLKDLFKEKNEKEALPLLKNRYRIFLTRGILGTYVYCEDETPRKLLMGIYESIIKIHNGKRST